VYAVADAGVDSALGVAVDAWEEISSVRESRSLVKGYRPSGIPGLTNEKSLRLAKVPSERTSY
jgi:hypothetical protein